jgi:hypothetical protein
MEDASSERRVFLESVCCDFFRFLHLDAGVPAENVLIRQEVAPDPGHVLRRLPSPGLITLATHQERRLKQETSPRRPASLDRIRPARGASSLPPWLGFARDRRPRCLRGSFATFPVSCSAPAFFAAQRWAPAARNRPEQAFASGARAITGECSTGVMRRPISRDVTGIFTCDMQC